MDYSRCLGLCFLWLSGRRAIETRFSHFEFGLFRITNFGAAPVLGNKMENKRFALPCLAFRNLHNNYQLYTQR